MFINMTTPTTKEIRASSLKPNDFLFAEVYGLPLTFKVISVAKFPEYAFIKAVLSNNGKEFATYFTKDKRLQLITSTLEPPTEPTRKIAISPSEPLPIRVESLGSVRVERAPEDSSVAFADKLSALREKFISDIKSLLRSSR